MDQIQQMIEIVCRNQCDPEVIPFLLNQDEKAIKGLWAILGLIPTQFAPGKDFEVRLDLETDGTKSRVWVLIVGEDDSLLEDLDRFVENWCVHLPSETLGVVGFDVELVE